MDVKTTSRGFEIVNFLDANGEECSLQQSSAIGNDDGSLDNPGSSFIWLGCDDAKPKIMASQASQYGVKTDETSGWIPFPVPDDVLMTTRMHLNRDHVRALLPILQRWVDTGALSE